MPDLRISAEGPLEPAGALLAQTVDVIVSAETETAATVEMLIQGGGSVGSTTLVEAAGATITGVGASPWEYDDNSPLAAPDTVFASTALYQSLSGSYRYDITVPGGLGSVWTFDLWLAPYGSGTRYVFSNRSTYAAAGDSRFDLFRGGSTLGFYCDGATRFTTPAPNGAWKFIRITYNGTQWRLQVDNTTVGTHNQPGLNFTGETYGLFGYGTTGVSGPMSGTAEDIRITKGLARVDNAPTAAMPYPEALGTSSYYGPLQSAQALLWNQFLIAQAEGPLQTPQALLWNQFLLAQAASPLEAPQSVLYIDFSGSLTGREVIHHYAELDGTAFRISSWQATLRAGNSNYVQCVIPAVQDLVDAINAATTFKIYRRAFLSSGQVVDYLMAESPIEQRVFNRGSLQYSCLLSGYSDGFAIDLDPPTIYDRTLTGIRSTTVTGSKVRVRCAVDFLLRPARRAYLEGQPFIVEYVNYYCQPNQEYMDVGGE